MFVIKKAKCGSKRPRLMHVEPALKPAMAEVKPVEVEKATDEPKPKKAKSSEKKSQPKKKVEEPVENNEVKTEE